MTQRTRRFADAAVARVFAAYPPAARRKLLALRELIFRTAARTPGVGRLEECLKWGEPAYVTAETKSGSTVRVDWKPETPQKYAIYFHCRTNLVDTFRSLFPRELVFEGNRALILDISAPLPRVEVECCIAAALTYHLAKRTG